jgi:uncharacterized protein (DUF488 family)
VELWTIGHSTRTIEAFLALLQEFRVAQVVDVRRFPLSRRHPHFAGPALAAALRTGRIGYAHEPDLGGHRRPQPGSVNDSWKDDALRGYADHMRTAEFQTALARVVERAANARTALLCAEALPSRCHRQLTADALVARGHRVHHILDPGAVETHAQHPSAVVAADGRVTYPARTQRRLFD